MQQTRLGRPRQFDEAAVLTAAMERFWSHGYHATSLTDLTAATGLHKGSLYGAFGDKHQLLLASLACYSRQRRAAISDDLAGGKTPLAGLRAYLERMALEAAGQRQRGRGCLMVNTALELLPGDEEVAAAVSAHRAATIELLAGALDAARAAGELTNPTPSSTLARLLQAVVVGMWELGRTEHDAHAMKSLALLALESTLGKS